MATTQLHRRNLSFQFLTIGAVAIMVMAGIRSTSAAIITWGAATTVAGDTDVSTENYFAGALNVGGAGAQTINGVTFAGDPTGGGPISGGGPVSFSFSFDASVEAGFEATGGLSASYDAALDSGRWNGAAGQSMTLSGLTPGYGYQVQIWDVDTRGCCAGRTATFDDGLGNFVTLASDAGGFGQFAIGTFTAAGGSQFIGINGNTDGATQLNLVQVRQLVPEPSSLLLMASGLGLLFYGARRFKAA